MSKAVTIIIIVIVVLGGAIWYFSSRPGSAPVTNTTTSNTTAQNTNAVQNTNTDTNTGGSFETTNQSTNTNSATDTTALEAASYTVIQDNYNFSPARLEAQVGQTVNVSLVNTGSEEHDFIIDELAVNSGLVAPGGTGVVSFIPTRAGTYPIYCGVGSHRELGMVGTLTVR